MFDATGMADRETVGLENPSIEGRRRGRRRGREGRLAVAASPLKRGFDILMAGLALLLFLPLLLMIAAAIRVESRGPAIFKQRRTGYRGQIFTIYKFRTMTVTEDSETVR